MNEIMKRETTEIEVTTDTIKRFLFGSGTKLTNQEMMMFEGIAIRNNLDPFKKEIYCIKYGNNFNVVTGYQIYIQRAENSGKLNGWNAENIKDDSGKVTGARVTIYRKDFEHPFIWEIERSEFDKRKSTWVSMPSFMTKKVCITQAFRLAFPNETSSLPYTTDEMELEENQNQVVQNKKPDVIVDTDKIQEEKTYKFEDIKPIITKQPTIQNLLSSLRMRTPEIEKLWNKFEGNIDYIEIELAEMLESKEAK